MKNKIRVAAAVLLVCSGVCMSFYPWISNWAYGQMVQSEVKVYEQKKKAADVGETARQWSMARQYNKALEESVVALTDPFFAEKEESETSCQDLYEAALQMKEDGLMGFVEIPKIQVYLPMYHGTSEQVLKHGAGHLQNSALPVGDRGCRPVISAHSGISTAKLFSDLTKLEEDDWFYLHVLDQVFAYQVCEIQVIWPDEAELLLPQKDRDLVSLLTCTPYGVNTQRLVVTGERKKDAFPPEMSDLPKNGENAGNGMVESDWMKNYRQTLIVGAGIVAATVFGHPGVQKRKKLNRHVFERRSNIGSRGREK